MTFLRKLNIFSYIFLDKSLFSLFRILIIVVICFTAIVNYLMYKNYSNRISLELEEAATRTDNLLEQTFQQTSQFMIYIGKQIALGDYKNLKFILTLLKNTPNVEEYGINSNAFSWTFVDWIDSDNFQRVNQKKGILATTLDMSSRSYTWKCRKHPWKLQFSAPVIGIPSGKFVIPSGIGVTDDNNKFLGILVVGFNIYELTKAIRNILKQEINFIILDEDLNIALYSAMVTDNKSIKESRLDISKNLFKLPRGILNTPIIYNNVSYSLYRKIPHFPYIILMGFNKVVFYNMLIISCVLLVIVCFGIGVFCFFMMHSSSKKTIYITQSSDKAKKSFISQINKRLLGKTTAILELSQVLVKCLNEKANINRQKELILAIHEAAINLKDFSIDELRLTSVDVNSIIKESVIIKSKDILEKNAYITTQLQPKLPLVYADKLCMKQIITGFISHAIEYSSRAVINISTFTKKDTQDKEKLFIIIQDNGFDINEEDIIRITSKLNQNFVPDHTNLSLDCLIQLVKINNGSYSIENKLNYGRTVTLSFSFNLSRLNYPFKKLVEVKGNVIPFTSTNKGTETLPPDKKY